MRNLNLGVEEYIRSMLVDLCTANGSMRGVTYQVLSYYAYRQNEILEFIETKDNIIKLIAQKEASKTRDEIDEINIKIYQSKYDFIEQMLEIYKHL